MNGRARVRGRWFGSLAIAGALAVLVSGCSGSSFPAVHDMPGPRIDTTLTPDEVKQATDNLTSDRDHLTAEAQSAVAVTAPNNTGLPPQPPPPPIIPTAAQSTGANPKP